MPEVLDPNFGITYNWDLGQNGWNTGMDANLKKLGALIHLSIIDKDLNAPPGSPVNGDRYIIGPSPTGAWASKANQVAVRVAGAWEYYVPATGWAAFVVDENTFYHFAGSAWSASIGASPYDIHVTMNGKPPTGVTLARVIFPRTTIFPSGLSGSYAKSEVAATASTTFTITKNNASVGTFNWAAAATSATFTMASQTTFNAGDVMEVVAPAADATLADLTVTLVGSR